MSTHLQGREGDCPLNVTGISPKQHENSWIHRNLPQDNERPLQTISRNWWGCEETHHEWPSKAFELVGCHSKCFLSYVITSLRVLQFIEGLIEQQPDILVSEIAEYLQHICHISVSPSTILRTLYHHGFSRRYCSSRPIIKEFIAKLPQVTRPAMEQDKQDCAEYKMLISAHFQPKHLVFADKSHFNCLSLCRSYAWAPWGDRARRCNFFVCGKQYALSLQKWK